MKQETQMQVWDFFILMHYGVTWEYIAKLVAYHVAMHVVRPLDFYIVRDFIAQNWLFFCAKQLLYLAGFLFAVWYKPIWDFECFKRYSAHHWDTGISIISNIEVSQLV